MVSRGHQAQMMSSGRPLIHHDWCRMNRGFWGAPWWLGFGALTATAWVRFLLREPPPKKLKGLPQPESPAPSLETNPSFSHLARGHAAHKWAPKPLSRGPLPRAVRPPQSSWCPEHQSCNLSNGGTRSPPRGLWGRPAGSQGRRVPCERHRPAHMVVLPLDRPLGEHPAQSSPFPPVPRLSLSVPCSVQGPLSCNSSRLCPLCPRARDTSAWTCVTRQLCRTLYTTGVY